MGMPWNPLARSMVHQNLGALRWGITGLGTSAWSAAGSSFPVSGSGRLPVLALRSGPASVAP
eukprot:scaffold108306_cov27-Phaeocystis_antarctica.AAC.1